MAAVAGVALLAAGGGLYYAGYELLGQAVMVGGAASLNYGVNGSTGVSASVDSGGNVSMGSYDPNTSTITSGGAGGGSTGGVGSSDDPTYFGHLVVYGNGDQVTDMIWGPFSRVSGDGPDTISLNPRGRVGGGSITSASGFPKNVMDSLYTEAYRLRNNDGNARVDLTMDVLTVVAVNAVGYQAGYEAVIWRYPNAGGAGLNVLRNGERIFGLDWHRFKSAGRMVNRPHIDIPGKVKHWPW